MCWLECDCECGSRCGNECSCYKSVAVSATIIPGMSPVAIMCVGGRSFDWCCI